MGLFRNNDSNGNGRNGATRTPTRSHDTVVIRDERTTTAYTTNRGLVGAARKLDTSKNADSRVEKRPTAAWQTAAWVAYDTIGEVHYGLSLIGQLVSRVKIFAGVVEDPDDEPTSTSAFIEKYADKGFTIPHTKEVLEKAEYFIHDLTAGAIGGESGMLREMAIGLSVAGEIYLTQTPVRWVVASNDELVPSQGQGGYKLKLDRQQAKQEIELPVDSFIARIWQPHPRVSNEPDSSMLGVLDSCENLALLSQQMRAMMRSRMNAGIVFIPEGLVGVSAEEGTSIEDAISQMAVTAVEDETATHTVVPLVLKGPPELGDAIKRIDIGRTVDAPMIALADRILERILVGLDIPKEIVSGLSGVKFANALVVDDNLFRSHIEPLALLIVDSLTSVYLQPLLKAWAHENYEDPKDLAHILKLIERIVVWLDPSDVVTRPDKSAAADAGWDRHILSGKAWRNARGFSDSDEPSEEELRMRMAIERAPIPPDLASPMIEGVDPAFFATERAAGQAAEGFPSELNTLLQGQDEAASGVPETEPPEGGTTPAPTPPAPAAPASQGSERAQNGGRIAPGGSVPRPVSTQ